MMKNKFLYIVLVITSIISSCKEDDFEPLNDVAECTWHMSTEAENISPIQLNLKEYISIMDLSQGNLSQNGLFLMMELNSLVVRCNGVRKNMIIW